MLNQLIIKSIKPFNKERTVETVRNSNVRRTDMFNLRIVL